jgi:predicted DNA-binding transcriptional regulator AlpA
MEQKPAVNESKPGAALAPVPALQLADRELLRLSLRPGLNKASFANWLFRMQRNHGFPEPIRTGSRSCSWSVPEVQAWLASRPRKGTFSGTRRHVGTAPAV